MVTNKSAKSLVLFVALTFALVISVSSASAYVINSTQHTPFNGTVYFPNGTAAQGVLINVTQVAHSNGSVVGVVPVYSAISNASGVFNFTLPISGSPGILWEVRLWSNATRPASGNMTFMSRMYSPMSAQAILDELSGARFELTPAITVNISVQNNTGSARQFNYTFIDNALGIVVVGNDSTPGSVNRIFNATNFTVPFFRNSSMGQGYTFIHWATYAAPRDVMGNGTAPVAIYITNLSAYSNTDLLTIAQIDGASVNSNTSIPVATFTGNFTATQNASQLNFTSSQRWIRLAHAGNITPIDYPFDNMTGMDGQGGADVAFINYTGDQSIAANGSGNFNVTVPSTLLNKPMNQSYILAGFANASNGYLAGFVELNATNNTAVYWIRLPTTTMKRLAGLSYYSDINATKVVFQTITSNGTTANYSTNEIFKYIVEVNYNGLNIKWSGTSNATGHFAVPLWADTAAKVRVYNTRYATQEWQISPEELAGTTTAAANVGMINLSVRQFNPQDPETVFSGTFTTDVYNTTNGCANVTLLSTDSVACNATAMRWNSFSDIGAVKQLAIGAANSTLRQAISGINIIFEGLDTTFAGIPQIQVDEQASKSQNDQFYVYSWKVGAPGAVNTYSAVRVGFPYEDSELDDDKVITANISRIYDSKWNTIWVPETNGTDPTIAIGALNGSLNQSVTNSSLFRTGIICEKELNHSDFDCYVNTTTNVVYVRFGSLLGYQVLINGTAKPGTATTSTSGGAGGSGGISGSGLISASLYWSAINAGTTTTFTSGEPRVPITKVVFTPAETAEKVRLTVETFDAEVPKDLTATSGLAYDYLQVLLTDGAGLEVPLQESAKINFKVDKAWLKDNNVDKSRIVLYRWEGFWKELPTILVNDGSENVEYQALTEGFSYFAVAAAGSTSPGTTGGTTGTGGLPSLPEVAAPFKKPTNLAIILIVGALLVFIYYELQKPRNKRFSFERRQDKRRAKLNTRRR